MLVLHLSTKILNCVYFLLYVYVVKNLRQLCFAFFPEECIKYQLIALMQENYQYLCSVFGVIQLTKYSKK